MASSSARKKKQVRFASLEDEEQEEDTLFDKRQDATGSGLKSVLKAAKRRAKPGCEEMEEAVVGVRGEGGSCGRWMVTLVLCASFLGLGMSISVLGPTFGDLALNVKKDISNISYIFVGRSGGYIGGSLVGGMLFDCMNPHLLLGLSLAITALGTCAIPFCQQALVLTALMSTIGVSMGVLDTGGNVLILKTWGDRAGPYMQALHFSFAVGGFVSPIIAKLLFGSALDVNASLLGNSSALRPADHMTVRYMRGGDLKSMWAYVVIGVFIFVVSLQFFVMWLRGTSSRDPARSSPSKPLLAKHHTALVVLLFFFFFAYVGSEVAYGSFIFTFGKEAGMDETQAAGLNSLFWATFAIFRGLSIFFATCMYPGTMILLSLVTSTVSTTLLCLFSREKAVIWAFTGVYGASLATVFPSGISWLEQYTTVTGRTAAAFVVGAGVGEMVLPAFLGFLLGRIHDQPLLMQLSLLCATFTSILFPVMYKLAAPGGLSLKTPVRSRRDADDSEYRQALLDSGANDDEEEEEEEEEEEGNEADQWNDADFEVIEMDDAVSPISSPNKSSASPPEVQSPPADAQLVQPMVSFSDSPRRKLALDREKND